MEKTEGPEGTYLLTYNLASLSGPNIFSSHIQHSPYINYKGLFVWKKWAQVVTL
jgi:hypothetical protein